jgi:hypothetical protein
MQLKLRYSILMYVLCIGATAGFVTTLGAPLLGAAYTIGWKKMAGGGPEWVVAERIYKALVPRFGNGVEDARPETGSFFDERLEFSKTEFRIGSCRDKFSRRIGERGNATADRYHSAPPDYWALVNLERVIDEDTAWELTAAFDRAAQQGLAALPRPILAALDQCIRRSLLAPNCTEYAISNAQGSTDAAMVALKLRKEEIERATELIWCAALGPKLPERG